MWLSNLQVYPVRKEKKQNILICIWYHAAFRDIAAPYLGSSADAPSPPLRDKNQNFDSSAPWAGARKFLAGSLCPTRGITPWSHQERPAKWSFPRLSACSSTIFGACFYPHVFLNWPWLLITQQLIPFNFDTHNVNYRLWVWVSVSVLKSFRHQKIATQQSLFKGTLKGQLCHLSHLKSKIQNHFHDSSTCNVGNGTLFINRAPPAGLQKDGKTLAACPECQQITQIYLETFNLRQKKLQCCVTVNKEHRGDMFQIFPSTKCESKVI